MERIRIYVPAYSLDDIYGHALEAVPPTHYPDVFDIMMVVGGISAGIFAFLLAARIVPMLSVWEMAEGLRLRVIRPFLRTETVVQAKPE